MQEQQTVRLLVEQFCLVRRYALPEEAWHYDRMISKAQTLERHFSGMANKVDNMSFELARLSVEINVILYEAGSKLRSLEP